MRPLAVVEKLAKSAAAASSRGSGRGGLGSRGGRGGAADAPARRGPRIPISRWKRPALPGDLLSSELRAVDGAVCWSTSDAFCRWRSTTAAPLRNCVLGGVLADGLLARRCHSMIQAAISFLLFLQKKNLFC